MPSDLHSPTAIDVSTWAVADLARTNTSGRVPSAKLLYHHSNSAEGLNFKFIDLVGVGVVVLEVVDRDEATETSKLKVYHTWLTRSSL